MKLISWNINALPPTLRNIVLRHGSLSGFMTELGADIMCFQAAPRCSHLAQCPAEAASGLA